MNIQLIHGDCLEKLKALEDNSIDSVVTDPPYGLSFMGKQWDTVVPPVDYWKEVLRVAKPGSHLLAFGGTRTFHRLAVAIEDAGWEIRDTVSWLYGSGFPKSHNIGKAIDKKLGNKREVVGRNPNSRENCDKSNTLYESGTVGKTDFITKGNSEWEGWGTALKPAWEPIILARKPFKGTVADNVLKYGTGGINIDESRVPFEDTPNPATNPKYRLQNGYKLPERGQKSNGSVSFTSSKNETNTSGRFPANLILDEEAGNQLGDASRFFYCAKATKKDRDEGLNGVPEKYYVSFQTSNGTSGKPSSISEGRKTAYKNNHPTVKPFELMKYLVRLITPPDGIVLDPFMGSGSTGKAVVSLGSSFIGIELNEEYIEIARRRIESSLPTGRD